MTQIIAFAAAIGFTLVLSTQVIAEGTSEFKAKQLPVRNVDEMRVHFYNVGAGTCTLVECPGKDARPIIVDCGTIENGWNNESGDIDKLKRRIINTLAGRTPDVVLSHSDKDHVFLIPYVLDIPEIHEIHEIWLGGYAENYARHEGIGDWIASQQTKGAVRGDFEHRWHNNREPITDGLKCGIAEAYVLTVNSVNNKKSYNANSLVLMLKYGSFKVIFTGDAVGKTEAAAIKNFELDKNMLRTTVLTSSHHGANSKGSNSANWAEATKPAVVIYSAGSSYSHPTCNVVERFDDILETTSRHNAICGLSKPLKGYKKFRTKYAQYMTRSSGNTTITTDGESSLRLDCEDSLGCTNISIPFNSTP